WPLAEKSGSTAVSVVDANEGTDNATYSNVTLGSVPGTVASSAVTAADFNGTSSKVNLPNLGMHSSNQQSVSLWFSAPAGAPAGVIFSYSDMPVGAKAALNVSMPAIYLGTSGHLWSEFWISSADGKVNPIESKNVVADGKWHNVVLTGSPTKQFLYIDGQSQVTAGIAGWDTPNYLEPQPWEDAFNYLGAGFLGNAPVLNNVWPDQPYSSTSNSTALKGTYFRGSLADAAIYPGTVLSGTDAAGLYLAGTQPDTLMTSALRPSGKSFSAVTYDPVSAAVTHVTDENGGSWGLSAPTTAGSSQVYRGAVFGGGPLAYYRLGDAAGSPAAASDVHYTPGTYTSTTLGTAGPFADESAATFNGTTSFLEVPKEVFASPASSQELWFRTGATTTGEVLVETQDAVGASGPGPYLPALWITPDGLLRALSPSTTPTGPFTAKSLAGKCIDDASSSTANGAKIEVYTCNGTAAQNWTMYPDGSLRTMGKCLDITGNGRTNGTLLQLYTCSGGTNQVWQYDVQGGLRNPASGLCLDDPQGSTVNGTQLQLYTCNGGAAQSWLQSLTSKTPVTDNKWHHALLASNGHDQQLYVDGQLVQSTNGTVPLVPGSLPHALVGTGLTGYTGNATSVTGLALGQTPHFKGSIGELAFYQIGLSAADAAAHYAAAKNSTGTTPLTTVSITDPGGKSLSNTYDPLNNDRQVASIDALGQKTSFGYDTGGFLHTTTDPNGDVTTTGHDAAGHVVSTTTCQNRSTDVCSTLYATFQPTTMGIDVAKAKTVTSTSISTTTGLNNTSYLVDGNVTSVAGALGFESALQTAPGTPQWVQVNLGSTQNIDQVAVYPRTDVAGGFPLTFTIQVSADGTTWKTETTQTNYPAPAAGGQAIFTFTPTNAQYVKLNATVLRASPTSGKYSLDIGELTALSDRPDPLAGVQLTQRDARSTSATDNTYLTSFGHDGLGDVTSVTSPAVDGSPSGRTTKIDYTDGSTVAAADGGFAPAGLTSRTTSPGGAVNQVSYNHNGDVAGSTDADGLVTTFGYDNLGRVVSKTVVSDTYPDGLTTTYAYDGQDRVVTEIDPPIADRVSGKIHTQQTTSGYDTDGGVTAETVADTTGGDVPRTVTTSFNAHDQVQSTVDPEQHTTTYEYDGYGNRTAEVDPQGNRTGYTFDSNGRLLTQVLANYIGDPSAPQVAAPLIELSRAYDPAGRLASITNAMGFITAYTYTDNGLPATATRTDADGKNPYVEKSDFYDAAGNLGKEITNNGATTTTIKVDAASRQTSTTLDPDGVNRTSTISYTLDDAIAANVTSDGTGATVTTTATYDDMGRTTSKSVRTNTPGYTDAITTRWHLDRRGLPTSQTDPRNNVTDFGYDEAGRPAVVTAPVVDVESDGNAPTHTRPTTKHGFDTFGDAVESQDANGNVTTTGYDRLGRAVSMTRPNYLAPGQMIPISATVTNTYDSAGNLTASRDADQQATIYGYDQLGDTVSKTTPDGGVTHSTYDLNGDLSSTIDPTGAVRQATYDHLGRMKTSTLIERYPSIAALTTNYSYAASALNPGGAWLASTTTAGGVVTSTGYDNVGETTSSTDGANNTMTYRYDLLGRQIAQLAPDGTSTTMSYDQNGDPVTSKALDAAGAVLTTQSASYDANGNQASATDARGHTTLYGYDAMNQLTSEVQPVSDASSITTSFGHDAMGNRTRYTDGRGNNWLYTYNSWELPQSTVEPATATYTSTADRTMTTA
ncbi:MAG: large repetitive protein, partial [Gaiellaceae bacterium]|nr:large repetitive protein [Gaiellaceae bacterium]